MLKLIIVLTFITNTYAQTCISHRAIVENSPENSLEALKRIVERVYEGVEIDIQFSKDGIPFLYHDSKLEKGLTGRHCPIGQKIKKLNFSQFYNQCFLENGERLATFEESLQILELYSGHVFIDLKQRANNTFYKLFEESALSSSDKVRFISFKKRALRPLRKRLPKSTTILLSRFIPRGLFYSGIGFNKRLNYFTGVYRYLDKDVSIWTLNMKSEILKSIEKKADFIITDDYRLCDDLT